MGADLGHRRRRRDRGVRDLPRARRPDDRHLGQRREARAGARAGAPTSPSTTTTGDVVAAVKEATGGGVDVVVETVGEATWARSLASVAPAGRVVVCGATSGPNPPAALHRFWWKQLDRATARRWGRARTSSAPTTSSRRGRARVHVDRVFPLAETRGRARAARGRRAARQDRPLDPGLSHRRSRVAHLAARRVAGIRVGARDMTLPQAWSTSRMLSAHGGWDRRDATSTLATRPTPSRRAPPSLLTSRSLRVCPGRSGPWRTVAPHRSRVRPSWLGPYPPVETVRFASVELDYPKPR